MEYRTKDSGDRVVYSTGGQREPQSGKGRFDLISPIGERRLAELYERGAEKYGADNMRRGLPMSRYLDSARRHLSQYLGGDRSEDHLAAAAWNCFEAMHTEEKIDLDELPEDLDDLP